MYIKLMFISRLCSSFVLSCIPNLKCCKIVRTNLSIIKRSGKTYIRKEWYCTKYFAKVEWCYNTSIDSGIERCRMHMPILQLSKTGCRGRKYQHMQEADIIREPSPTFSKYMMELTHVLGHTQHVFNFNHESL